MCRVFHDGRLAFKENCTNTCMRKFVYYNDGYTTRENGSWTGKCTCYLVWS